MLIKRSCRPRTKRTQEYSYSVTEAAKVIGINNEKIYNQINDGLIFTTAPLNSKDGQRISYNELIEYARYIGIELWNTIPMPKEVYVLPWKKGIKFDFYNDHLYEFIKRHTGYDGSIYTGRINSKDHHALNFVCSNLFRYNQIQMRHRPYASQRHVYLCWKTESEEKKCRSLQKEMNEKYASEIIRVCELEL